MTPKFTIRQRRRCCGGVSVPPCHALSIVSRVIEISPRVAEFFTSPRFSVFSSLFHCRAIAKLFAKIFARFLQKSSVSTRTAGRFSHRLKFNASDTGRKRFVWSSSEMERDYRRWKTRKTFHIER